MRRVLQAVTELLTVVFKHRPSVVVLCTIVAIISGAFTTFTVWINERIIDLGLMVASKQMTFTSYVPYILGVCVCYLAPTVLHTVLHTYIYPTAELIIRSEYKGKMLQKLKLIKYEHMENSKSVEIIDKAYTRAEEAALHLFPSYYFRFISSSIAIGSMIFLFSKVSWLLPITIIVPFVLDTYAKFKNRFNIYDEMETYWKREHQYLVLGNMLKSREYLSETHLLQASDYLIDTYEKRLNKRNKEFEHFYFKNLKNHWASQNISRIAQVLNAMLLLYFFFNGKLMIGQLISMTITVFSSLGYTLNQLGSIIKWSGYQAKAYQYYDMFFCLSEDQYGKVDVVPKKASIEFRNVSFKYPGTDKQVLNQVSFVIENGEKVALVGKNGEGKTTILKLLLGLFEPDCGEIFINGILLKNYSQRVRERLFSAIFQDFTKYELTLNENVGIGSVDNIHDLERIQRAIKKAKIDDFCDRLPNGGQTLLGRKFDGGLDVSGGQWQRIAIARALMGNRPIMVLDEPTSQIDPMSESKIYADFAQVSSGKTTLFVTHRLGATMIMDRIFVLSDGIIVESGSHTELMQKGGIYAEMFASQKKWYKKNTGGGANEGLDIKN